MNNNENLPAIKNKGATAIIVNPAKIKTKRCLLQLVIHSSSARINVCKEDESWGSISSNIESDVYSRSDYIKNGNKSNLIFTLQHP